MRLGVRLGVRSGVRSDVSRIGRAAGRTGSAGARQSGGRRDARGQSGRLADGGGSGAGAMWLDVAGVRQCWRGLLMGAVRPWAPGGRPSTAALGARRRRRRARAARAQGRRHGGQRPTPKGGARKREGRGTPSRRTEHGRTGADDDDDGRPGPHARRTNRPEPQGARPDADARRGCPPERHPAAHIPASACLPAVCPSTGAAAARQSHLSATAERLPGRPLSNVKKK